MHRPQSAAVRRYLARRSERVLALALRLRATLLGQCAALPPNSLPAYRVNERKTNQPTNRSTNRTNECTSYQTAKRMINRWTDRLIVIGRVDRMAWLCCLLGGHCCTRLPARSRGRCAALRCAALRCALAAPWLRLGYVSR